MVVPLFPRLTPRAIAALAGLLASQAASAQCSAWRPDSGLYGLASIYASTTWDPDGAGPQLPLTVVAGNFDHLGNADGPLRSNIAAWDGSQWIDLGGGIGSSASAVVEALAVYNGDLIAAGTFASAGGSPAANIARWNGTTWQPLGPGIAGPNSRVYALTVRNGVLVAGGSFTSAGGSPAANIATWNGSAWSPLSIGTNGPVLALITAANGDLIAGGSFSTAGGLTSNHVARWNDAFWFPMTSGMNGFYVLSLLKMPNGDIIAGGDFTFADGLPARGIARWNGFSWHPLDTGVSSTFPSTPYVASLALHNGQLVAGGRFTHAGGLPARSVARWDGITWSPLPGGIGQAEFDSVETIVSAGDDLFLAGSFASAGGIKARSVARWNSGVWLDTPGFVAARNGFLSAFAPWAGSLVIAGNYATTNTNLPTLSRHLTIWNGDTLADLGTPDGPVYALATAPAPAQSSNLFVAGNFSSIGGVAASRVARVNSTIAGWAQVGQGFNAEVFALAHNPADNALYAGGNFTLSGGTTVNRVARLIGSTWQPLASGIDGPVLALLPFNGSIFAAGAFSFASGAFSPGLARWDGSFWNGVGLPNGSVVYALASFQNQLIIAGSFPGPNDSPGILAFDGTQFLSLGTGGLRKADNSAGIGLALTVHDNALYLGGDFDSVAGVPADALAKWDGNAWAGVSGSMPGEVRALASFRGELQVAGTHNYVENGAVQSPLWARFAVAASPWFALHPLPASVECGQTATFAAASATGYGASLLWRRNGLPLVDGPTGTGSFISGSHAPVLSIANVSSLDIAVYDCVATSPCGAVTSNGAALDVRSPDAPVILAQPTPIQACPAGSVGLTILVQAANTPVSYQWQRESPANSGTYVDLAPGSLPSGTSFAGVHSPNLLISNLAPADATRFRCLLARGCATLASDPALVSVCYANCDCSFELPYLNVNDFSCFLNAFAAAQSLAPALQVTAYANCDGSTTPPVLNVNDFSCFMNRFAAGCP